MLKKIAFAAAGLALFAAPFIASAQIAVPDDCSSNLTVACLQNEIQQLVAILNQLLLAHNHQPSATINQSSLMATSGGSGITYQAITGTASNVQQLIVTIQGMSNFYVTVGNGIWTINAPVPTVGNYAVQVIDNDPGTNMGTVLATGTLTVNGPIPGNPASGSLTASNPNPIPASIVAGGTTGVTVGAFTLQPSGENMYLQQIGLDLQQQKSVSASDITQAYVYEGSTLVGTVSFAGSSTGTCPPAFTGVPAGSCYFATTTISASSQLVNGTQTNFTIKADIAPVGPGMPATVGDQVVIGLADAVVSGANGGAYIHSGPAPAQVGARIFKSYPIVAQIPLPSSAFSNTTAAQPLMRFSITANPSGPIGVAVLSFLPAENGVSLSNVQLFAYTDSGFSQPVAQTKIGYVGGVAGVVSGQVFSIGPTTPLEIPAGTTYYFELDGGVSSKDVASLSMTLEGDSSYLFGPSSIAVGSNFVWSPNDNGTTQEPGSDWTNGYEVMGLPSVGLTQTIAGNGPNPAPPATFTVTPASGAAPLTVTYTANYFGTGFNLDYGDGSPEIGQACSGGCTPSARTGQSGTHTYTSPGTYTLTFTPSCTGSVLCNQTPDNAAVTVTPGTPSTPPNAINAACPVNYLNNGICSLSHLIGVHTVSGLTPTFFSFVRPGLVYTVNFGDGTEQQVPTCTLPLSGQSSSCTDAGYFTHTYPAPGTYQVSVIDYTCASGSTPCNLIIDSTSVTLGVSQSVSLSGNTNSQIASALTALESAIKAFLGN